mmetsp:Transcript_9877/g.11389  ORF Transcript_9877/g.11389 Transcript_9877/m.11389 type:complete len:337 (+) Transcript_9877:124-1134(+)
MNVSVFETAVEKLRDTPHQEVILSLTTNAREIYLGNVESISAKDYADFILSKILRAEGNSFKLNLLYLCDSIMKDTAEYSILFLQKLPGVFVYVWSEFTGYRRDLCFKLLQIWEQRAELGWPGMDQLVHQIKEKLYQKGELAHMGALSEEVNKIRGKLESPKQLEHSSPPSHKQSPSINSPRNTKNLKRKNENANDDFQHTKKLLTSKGANSAPIKANDQAKYSEQRFVDMLYKEAKRVLKRMQAEIEEESQFTLEALESKPQIYHDLLLKAYDALLSFNIVCESDELVQTTVLDGKRCLKLGAWKSSEGKYDLFERFRRGLSSLDVAKTQVVLRK